MDKFKETDKFTKQMIEQNQILFKECKCAYKFGVISFILIALVMVIFIYKGANIFSFISQTLSLSLITWSIFKVRKTMDSIKKRLERYESI